MGRNDNRPTAGTPVSNRIAARHNNRVGAAYSSLYAFWRARHSAVSANAPGNNRRDSYSVILFNDAVQTVIPNDVASAPEALVDQLLPYGRGGGTDYTLAIRSAQDLMVQNWSPERSEYRDFLRLSMVPINFSRVPVIIFLSDGECDIADVTMRNLCRRSLGLG